jgi:hypothetical protein
MLDFPITDLLDDSLCLLWLERHLHPDGFVCPHCGSVNRRLFRQQRHFPAYRCRECDGYYTLLTGTTFAKTRQSLATLRRMGQFAIAPKSGRAMTMGMGNVRCIAIPAKGRARRCARICGCSVVSIRRIWYLLNNAGTNALPAGDATMYTALSRGMIALLSCLRSSMCCGLPR